MKVLMPLAAGLALTLLPGVTLAGGEREAKPRFKGVELYSWRDKGEWLFVLLDGTNREKSEDEVKGADRLKGAEALGKALARLARGEQVSWSHRGKGFEFPDKKIRGAIEKAAKAAGIELSIGAGD